MYFTYYSLEQSEQWDSIVRSFGNYDVYWLSGYVKAFCIHGDGDPLLFYYEDNASRGINVVMKRDIANDQRFKGKFDNGIYFDFATPYGYGGWIIEGDYTANAFNTYDSWLKDNGIVSEFVRFHPLIKNHKTVHDFYTIIQLGNIVHMELDSPEIIWGNIESKNRNMIRKALKNGVHIYRGTFPEIYDEFQTLYNATMDKDRAEQYYYFGPEFYKSVLDDLPQNAQVFWAEKDHQVIAASIILAANGMMNYHLSGSLQEFRSLAPTNLLLYKAALWGNANGYRTFNLGGGVGSGNDNLFRFKKSFYKGDLNYYYLGKRIVDQDKYDNLVNMRDSINNRLFFPLYRG